LNGLKEVADTILVPLDVMTDVLNVVKEDILLAIAEDEEAVVAENEVIVLAIAVVIVLENGVVAAAVDLIVDHLLENEVVVAAEVPSVKKEV